MRKHDDGLEECRVHHAHVELAEDQVVVGVFPVCLGIESSGNVSKILDENRIHPAEVLFFGRRKLLEDRLRHLAANLVNKKIIRGILCCKNLGDTFPLQGLFIECHSMYFYPNHNQCVAENR